jgi:hypothetical protein
MDSYLFVCLLTEYSGSISRLTCGQMQEGIPGVKKIFQSLIHSIFVELKGYEKQLESQGKCNNIAHPLLVLPSTPLAKDRSVLVNGLCFGIPYYKRPFKSLLEISLLPCGINLHFGWEAVQQL